MGPRKQTAQTRYPTCTAPRATWYYKGGSTQLPTNTHQGTASRNALAQDGATAVGTVRPSSWSAATHAQHQRITAGVAVAVTSPVDLCEDGSQCADVAAHVPHTIDHETAPRNWQPDADAPHQRRSSVWQWWGGSTSSSDVASPHSRRHVLTHDGTPGAAIHPPTSPASNNAVSGDSRWYLERRQYSPDGRQVHGQGGIARRLQPCTPPSRTRDSYVAHTLRRCATGHQGWGDMRGSLEGASDPAAAIRTQPLVGQSSSTSHPSRWQRGC